MFITWFYINHTTCYFQGRFHSGFFFLNKTLYIRNKCAREKGWKVNNSRLLVKYYTWKFRHESFSDINEDGGTKSPSALPNLHLYTSAEWRLKYLALNDSTVLSCYRESNVLCILCLDSIWHWIFLCDIILSLLMQ